MCKMKLFISLLICVSILSVECAYSVLHLNAVNDNVKWNLKNSNGSISISVPAPSGVYTNLFRAGIIGDILSGFNDVLTRWVAHDDWTYTCLFNVSEYQFNASISKLVFNGIDTVADIELNGVHIGNTNNMFVRYVFNVKEHLQIAKNELKLSFKSPIKVSQNRSQLHYAPPECVPAEYHGECQVNQIRKMQASYGWDWGPAFPSVGVWKPANIEFYEAVIIRSVTTKIEDKDTSWGLRILVHLESSGRKPIIGYLSASLKSDGEIINIGREFDVTTRDDGTTEVELNMTISQNKVRVWWPNGYGDQPLYALNVHVTTFEDNAMVETVHKHIQIGFRTLEIVEKNASTVLGNTAAGVGLTFYFKINGYPLFMKGSNWIPLNILPEHGDDRHKIDSYLTAARDAHMSMLRVWGGGVYESEYFYRRCDQLGILIWQDFLFACSMYPVDTEFLQTVKTEVEQNVIRLQHHPSIAVWAGNNENEVALRGNWYNTASKFNKYKQEYITLYVDIIKPIVESFDPGRRYLVSSPSNGLESEQEGYVAKNPYDSHYGDTHYYNYFADNWDQNVYPPTRFASEYGFQSMPSLATMKTATTNKEDFSLDSEYSKHRQHSPNGYSFIESQITRHLKLDKNDSKYFEKFVFYSQINQAMAMKAETEFYRQNQADWYTMGALYWQLNDVWQAPSWSGIESTGKWKMLHYFAKSFFAPVLVSPRLLLSGDISVYLINDRFVPILDATINVDVFNWSCLIPIASKSYPARVGPLSSKKQDLSIDLLNGYNKEEVFLRFSISAVGVQSSPYNFIFPKPLKSVKGLKEPRIQIKVSKRPGRPDERTEYAVDIRVDTVMLFLWLELDAWEGQFENNGFILTRPNLRVNYITNRNIPVADIEKAITYQYYIN